MVIWYGGIDPGAKGAMARIAADDPNQIQVVRFTTPEETSRQFDFWRAEETFFYLEGVGARPGEGGMSLFRFGQNYGFWLGQLLAYGYQYDIVFPQTWQRVLGLGQAFPSKKERKNAHKAKAQSLYPALKVTLIDCDAILIAEYTRRMILTGRKTLG